METMPHSKLAASRKQSCYFVCLAVFSKGTGNLYTCEQFTRHLHLLMFTEVVNNVAGCQNFKIKVLLGHHTLWTQKSGESHLDAELLCSASLHQEVQDSSYRAGWLFSGQVPNMTTVLAI
ncbi:uncharacterized protein LOC143441835 [Arvicanthis niloticus]|uniref:uncharacterized protein LOC143312064 n=1 Tax=Arvicanthis niloticus TaxID=61156 RepID=UPI00402BDA5B